MSPLFKLLHAFVLVLLLLSAAAANVGAQEPDPVDKFIQDMVQMHQDKSMCVANPSSPAVRTNVITYLKVMGEQISVTPKALATAMWTLYPCPFSPFRP